MIRRRMYAVALSIVLSLVPAFGSFGAEPGNTGSWRQDNGQWYYYDGSGNMLTGWIQVNGKHYYLYEDGHCAMNEITPDGYRVDASGAWYEVKWEIMGQEFKIPARFLTPSAAGDGWGENGEALKGLGAAVNTAFSGVKKLSVTKDGIEYMSSGGETRYLGLYKDQEGNGYRLDVRILLDGSSSGQDRYAEYDYSVFKAMAALVSSTPDQLEAAIYSAWQGQNTYGITRGTPVTVGDCTVTYEAGQGYGKFFIRP